MNIKPTNISEEEKTRIFEESSKNQTPYVEKEPVKHGEWRKDELGYDVYVECSECGLNLSISNYIENEWREILKYCPNCGARMDGDDNA